MNRSQKIILATISSLVVLCLCVVAAGVVAVRSAGWCGTDAGRSLAGTDHD